MLFKKSSKQIVVSPLETLKKSIKYHEEELSRLKKTPLYEKYNYENRILNLIGLEPQKAMKISAIRNKHKLTKEVILAHLSKRNSFTKEQVRKHNGGCGCIICKLTNIVRSYEAELIRLHTIKKNIEMFGALKKEVESFHEIREIYKYVHFRDLISYFSTDFENNLPIMLPLETANLRDTNVRYLIPNNCTEKGSQYRLVCKSIDSINKKLSQVKNARANLKRLTYLP